MRFWGAELGSPAGSRSPIFVAGLRSQAIVRRAILVLWDVGSWSLGLAAIVGVRLDFALADFQ